METLAGREQRESASERLILTDRRDADAMRGAVIIIVMVRFGRDVLVSHARLGPARRGSTFGELIKVCFRSGRCRQGSAGQGS